MKPLPIGKSTATDLEKIAEIDPNKLEELVSVMRDNPKYLRSVELLSKFEKHVGKDAGQVVLKHVASLNLLRDEDGEEAKVIFDALCQGVIDAERADLFEKLSKLESPFTALIEDETVYLSVKGARLFAADALHLHDLKMYCDVRPVFGPHRQNIHAYIVYTSMNMVASDDQENEERFTVAMREKDLHNLIKECQTALEKLKAVEKTVTSSGEVEVILYGRD